MGGNPWCRFHRHLAPDVWHMKSTTINPLLVVHNKDKGTKNMFMIQCVYKWLLGVYISCSKCIFQINNFLTVANFTLKSDSETCQSLWSGCVMHEYPCWAQALWSSQVHSKAGGTRVKWAVLSTQCSSFNLSMYISQTTADTPCHPGTVYSDLMGAILAIYHNKINTMNHIKFFFLIILSFNIFASDVEWYWNLNVNWYDTGVSFYLALVLYCDKNHAVKWHLSRALRD